MTRAQTIAMTTLVDSAEVGGYTLPTELTDAWRIYTRTRELSVDVPDALDPETVAARVVSAVAAGEDGPDVIAAAAALRENQDARRDAEQARTVLARAVEQAGELATNLATDLTESIITEHLRPALEDVWAQTREVVELLGSHTLDPYALITAPAKVRNAYARLPILVQRDAAIQSARRLVNSIGDRRAQQDASGLFATFRKPLAFHPQWRHPAPVPRLPFPEDPTTCLLWIAGEASKAEPWLPTVAEQDAAWWEQFGEGQRMRQQASRNAQAVGARIG